LPNYTGRQIRDVENDAFRLPLTETLRHRKVDAAGQHVAKVVDLERTLVRYDGLNRAAAIPAPQHETHKLLPVRIRIKSQSINTPTLAEPITSPLVIVLRLIAVPGL
jgi:hypothetical protein